jgi:hypothetical protein
VNALGSGEAAPVEPWLGGLLFLGAMTGVWLKTFRRAR